MQFSDLAQIETIARHNGFSIFEIPITSTYSQILPHAIHIKKIESTSKTARDISIEQLREIFPIIDEKQHQDLFIVIEQGDCMSDGAANAFLKHLEEPNEYIHYLLLTKDLNLIKSTIRSRAQIYRQKRFEKINDIPSQIDAKILTLAKEYLACSPEQLPSFVKKITKDSKTARSKATAIVDAAIILMYKSYFATGNQKFLTKLEQLLQAEACLATGNLKLQLVAHMV